MRRVNTDFNIESLIVYCRQFVNPPSHPIRPPTHTLPTVATAAGMIGKKAAVMSAVAEANKIVNAYYALHEKLQIAMEKINDATWEMQQYERKWRGVINDKHDDFAETMAAKKAKQIAKEKEEDEKRNKKRRRLIRNDEYDDAPSSPSSSSSPSSPPAPHLRSSPQAAAASSSSSSSMHED